MIQTMKTFLTCVKWLKEIPSKFYFATTKYFEKVFVYATWIFDILFRSSQSGGALKRTIETESRSTKKARFEEPS